METNIKKIRTQKKLTQTKLGQLSGIERTAIVRIESGSQGLSASNALKIAKALGCTVEELFTREDKEKEESEDGK